MATAERELTPGAGTLGDLAATGLIFLGDLGLFTWQTLGWMVRRHPAPRTLLPAMYSVGVQSVSVVAITGMFIGMVLAVQSYGQFHQFGWDTHLGGIINISVVRELGPVLAATMLAGRIGSAMAAELATMRVTEQIDALACLGANPLHYLVVPRFLACVLFIPLLTIMADFMGVMGGALICLRIYHVEAHYYWLHAENYLSLWDIVAGLIKPLFFGAAIAVISSPSGLPQPGRGRRRGPGRHRGLCCFLRRHPHARLLPGPVPEQPSRLPLALCGTANDLS